MEFNIIRMKNVENVDEDLLRCYGHCCLLYRKASETDYKCRKQDQNFIYTREQEV
jgi:hypothetical protein